MKNIIFILTTEYDSVLSDFYTNLSEYAQYDTYVVIDNNEQHVVNDNDSLSIIRYEKGICEQAGYKNTVLQVKNGRSCARDKALFYLNHNNIEYDNVWLIESDVFIPTLDTIPDIDTKYQAADLLVAENSIYTERSYDWHWEHVYKQTKLDLPYGKSMICAIRCSKQLITCIGNYAMNNNSLFLDETLFNTISLHNNLRIISVPELSTIRYRGRWRLEDIKLTNLYHPMKQTKTHINFRKRLKHNKHNYI